VIEIVEWGGEMCYRGYSELKIVKVEYTYRKKEVIR